MSKNETSGQDSRGIDLKTTLCDDGRERPTRSKSADFGGEASGMDDLGGTPEIDDTDARRDDAPETWLSLLTDAFGPADGVSGGNPPPDPTS
ncbi:hypothetical protein [Halococcus thailandensis]|uniref:Uncharacterized protein n=1 Tax=Halococcus thailandensis JCM 13552 TaxID=1227457 RepID=M0MSI9_9EURY|nr:hypothetical protein [Halococcus thailandensis]EMA48702.1 hypothetical protein C451_20088 [Halococcus thailandensis JCM 13552]